MDASYQGTRDDAAAASAPLDDGEFLAALESATLPAACFDHAAHVRAGYLYLCRQPFPQAAAAMCGTIRAYAGALGKPERYHETITIAFMALINAQLRLQGADGGWHGFRARNPQLLRGDALLAYYPREVLESQQARDCFTLPPLAGRPGGLRRRGDHGGDRASDQ